MEGDRAEALDAKSPTSRRVSTPFFSATPFEANLRLIYPHHGRFRENAEVERESFAHGTYVTLKRDGAQERTRTSTDCSTDT